jgi:hypothetical protein
VRARAHRAPCTRSVSRIRLGATDENMSLSFQNSSGRSSNCRHTPRCHTRRSGMPLAAVGALVAIPPRVGDARPMWAAPASGGASDERHVHSTRTLHVGRGDGERGGPAPRPLGMGAGGALFGQGHRHRCKSSRREPRRARSASRSSCWISRRAIGPLSDGQRRRLEVQGIRAAGRHDGRGERCTRPSTTAPRRTGPRDARPRTRRP